MKDTRYSMRPESPNQCYVCERYSVSDADDARFMTIEVETNWDHPDGRTELVAVCHECAVAEGMTQ